MKNLLERLLRLDQSRAKEVNIASEFFLVGGVETQTNPALYHWDGQRRGVDPEHPYLLMQFTLDGRGEYADPTGTYKMVPGSVFIAPIPSEHHYFLPKGSPAWSFFYLMTSHPYVVRRIRDVQDNNGKVLTVEEDSPLIIRAVHLLEGTIRADFADDLAQEQSLFELMFEYERMLHRASYPQDLRESMLNAIRTYTLSHLHSSFDIIGVSDHFGMSRSNFSHRFKTVTGLSPATYIQQIRLEEATRRLVSSDQKLEAIASQTGFADANHLCKVFRRRFHLSPGEFRRQIR